MKFEKQKILDCLDSVKKYVFPRPYHVMYGIDLESSQVSKIFVNETDVQFIEKGTYDDFYNSCKKVISEDSFVEVCNKWENEVLKAKENSRIDLGLIKVNKQIRSDVWFKSVAFVIEGNPVRKIFILSVDISDKVKSSQNLKKIENCEKKLLKFFDVIGVNKFSELLRIDLKTYNVYQINFDKDGYNEIDLNVDWIEQCTEKVHSICPIDKSRFIKFTSKSSLENLEESKRYKLFFRYKNEYDVENYVWSLSIFYSIEGSVYVFTIDDIEYEGLVNESNSSTLKTNSYKKAFISDASAFYEFNISRNMIIGSPVQRLGDKNISLLETYNLNESCSYTDFINELVMDIPIDEQEKFLAKTDLNYYKECFNRGENEVWFENYRLGFDNQVFWAKNTTFFVEDEETGDLIGLTVVKNVTELHKNEEEKLFQFEIINSLSADYTDVLIMDIDTGKLLPIRLSEAISSFYKEIIGNSSYEDAKDLYIDTSVYEDDRDMLQMAFSVQNIKKQLILHESFYANFRAYINNQLKFIKLKIVRVGNPFDFTKVILAFMNVDDEIEQEISQKKKLEEALFLAHSASRSKTQFLSSMSHDIRTPMNAIIGFTTLAENHSDDKNLLKEYLSKIKSNSTYMLSLINDVLDMSRIESGNVKISPVPCRIEEIIDELYNIVYPQIELKNITLKFEKKNISSSVIMCDKLRLNQILINILGNAIKFTKENGMIIFTIKEIPSSNKEYSSFQFTIKDNGIGMSKELLAHVFEPFTREKNPEIEKIQGSGLGMAITKNLVDLMEGQIFVSSQLNFGTEILICLDFKNSSEEELQSKQSENTKEVSIDRIKGSRLLLVEDNEFNREIANSLLVEQGFQVDCAENGQVAVDMIASSEDFYYKAILMDVQMPVLNGLEATEKIRQLENKNHSSIPIIAMTANAFEEDKKKALDVGMSGFVSKPFDLKILLQVLSDQIKS